MITIDEDRKWIDDTNNEWFIVIEYVGVYYGSRWYIIQYDTDGRKQTVREQDLLEKSVAIYN